MMLYQFITLCIFIKIVTFNSCRFQFKYPRSNNSILCYHEVSILPAFVAGVRSLYKVDSPRNIPVIKTVHPKCQAVPNHTFTISL